MSTSAAQEDLAKLQVAAAGENIAPAPPAAPQSAPPKSPTASVAYKNHSASADGQLPASAPGSVASGEKQRMAPERVRAEPKEAEKTKYSERPALDDVLSTFEPKNDISELASCVRKKMRVSFDFLWELSLEFNHSKVQHQFNLNALIQSCEEFTKPPIEALYAFIKSSLSDMCTRCQEWPVHALPCKDSDSPSDSSVTGIDASLQRVK